MFCPSCGKRLPDGAKFCTNCGRDLTASAEHTADTPAAPDTPDAPPTPEGSTPEASTASAKRPTPKWLLALVAVLAVAVVGVGSYALTRAVTGQGADASQATAKKADGGKKGAKPTGGTKADAGKSDASDSSDAGAKSGTGEKNDGSAGGATPGDDSYVVRAEGFQFTLPSYWRGKVDVVVDEDEVDIYPRGYAPAADSDSDKAALVSLELEDGTEPDVAGDIGNFLAYSQTLGSPPRRGVGHELAVARGERQRRRHWGLEHQRASCARGPIHRRLAHLRRRGESWGERRPRGHGGARLSCGRALGHKGRGRGCIGEAARTRGDRADKGQSC
jgi:hypothetical protein